MVIKGRRKLVSLNVCRGVPRKVLDAGILPGSYYCLFERGVYAEIKRLNEQRQHSFIIYGRKIYYAYLRNQRHLLLTTRFDTANLFYFV